MLGISILYLGYSYLYHVGPVNYMIRQYALFIYLGLSWFIFSSYINDQFNDFNIRFIVLIGLVSVIIQMGYHGYLAIFSDHYLPFGEFNYFSKMGILGIIVFGAWALCFIKNTRIKWSLVAFYLFLSTTLGHSSAFLACFVVVMTYLMLGTSRKVKITALTFLGLSLLLFILFLPQFSDQNAEWRLVYWKSALGEILKSHFALLGHGFGAPYASQEVIDAFREQINSPWFEVRPEEAYVTPMHNSFITFAFHIGLIPSLLLFIPLKKAIRYFIKVKHHTKFPKNDFLILCFVGVSVFSAFNVVLELPHSSSFYWLIYFSLIYQCRKQDVAQDEK